MKGQEGIPSNVQIIEGCSLEVTQDALNGSLMILSRDMHKLTYLVDCIANIRYSESKILQSLNNLFIACQIRVKSTMHDSQFRQRSVN